MIPFLQMTLGSMYAVDDRAWARMFPADTNPTAERERKALDDAAIANAQRIDALNVPEPFFIDRSTGIYYVNPARVAYDAAHQ